MPKTTNDVAQRALEILGVKDVEGAADYAEFRYARDAWASLFADLPTQGITPTWTADTVPDALFLAVASLIAAEVGSAYGFPAPSRAAAMGRIRAYSLPDDRPDPRDLDDDGTVTTAEADAYARSLYY